MDMSSSLTLCDVVTQSVMWLRMWLSVSIHSNIKAVYSSVLYTTANKTFSTLFYETSIFSNLVPVTRVLFVIKTFMSNHLSAERQVDLWRVNGCFTGFMGSSYSTLMIRRYTVFNVHPFDTNGYFREVPFEKVIAFG